MESQPCLLFTPKSYDTETCLEELEGSLPEGVPIICFQNGVGNEEKIAGKFAAVYGGVCRMTCSFLHPGRVTFRKLGRVVLGKYPRGTDPFIKKVASAFAEAGLDCGVSRSIMCDKWLKLVTNLQSTLHAIVDGRDHDSEGFSKLKMGLLEEAKKALGAGKIKARSCDDRDASLAEMIEDLKRPLLAKGGGYIKVCNSTWQNLYLERPQLESRFFHGPIIEMAKAHGISVPYNEVVLEAVERCQREKLGPEAMRADDLLAEVERRKGRKKR